MPHHTALPLLCCFSENRGCSCPFLGPRGRSSILPPHRGGSSSLYKPSPLYRLFTARTPLHLHVATAKSQRIYQIVTIIFKRDLGSPADGGHGAQGSLRWGWLCGRGHTRQEL